MNQNPKFKIQNSKQIPNPNFQTEKRLSLLLGQEVISLTKLFGEASYRIYNRIFLKDKKTLVLMAMPEGKMSVSEEITNLNTKPAELPFIDIQRYLKTIGMPVPTIEHFSEKEGWIILEDLGDTKLWDAVQKSSPQERIVWYKKAIDLLVQLQKVTSPDSETPCIAFQRSFDATLFNWEFDHFWEYYIKCKNQKSKIKREDEELFKTETRKITNELCRLPQGFTHRDYQSRNLMVQDHKLYMIDFQDALLGPKVYDLVALLRDSYVDLTPDLDQLLQYYCEKSGEDFKIHRHAFDLQTVQRKLKDAGRFVFIDRVKKNPNFLPYIPTSLNYVRQALERLPEYKNLYTILKKHIREWQ